MHHSYEFLSPRDSETEPKVTVTDTFETMTGLAVDNHQSKNSLDTATLTLLFLACRCVTTQLPFYCTSRIMADTENVSRSLLSLFIVLILILSQTCVDGFEALRSFTSVDMLKACVSDLKQDFHGPLTLPISNPSGI